MRFTSRLPVLSVVLGVLAIAACSSPSPSQFSSAEKDDKSGPSGTFGKGDDEGKTGGTTSPKAGCVPAKGNYDIPGDKCDNDADGTVDNPPSCDASLAADGTAEDFAHAMGICDSAAKSGFGLVSAKFTRGYQRDDLPQAAQHGVLDKFGSVL